MESNEEETSNLSLRNFHQLVFQINRRGKKFENKIIFNQT